MNRQQLESKAIAAAHQLLRTKGIVSMVEVLMSMGKLSKTDYERWRFRQVPYLEKVMPGNLNQFQFLLRVVRAHARAAKLKPSHTIYTSWGKGPRERLRFSKTGNPHIEEQYSTHFVSPELKKTKLTNGEPNPGPPKPILDSAPSVPDAAKPSSANGGSNRSAAARSKAPGNFPPKKERKLPETSRLDPRPIVDSDDGDPF